MLAVLAVVVAVSALSSAGGAWGAMTQADRDNIVDEHNRIKEIHTTNISKAA